MQSAFPGELRELMLVLLPCRKPSPRLAYSGIIAQCRPYLMEAEAEVGPVHGHTLAAMVGLQGPLWEVRVADLAALVV